MKAVAAIVCTLLVSLVVNYVLFSRCRTLTAERDRALADLIVSEQARAADHAALAVTNQAREAAVAKAQERRDALQVPHADTDDDVLRVCRDSLCPAGARRADTAARAADAVPAPGTAGGSHAR